MFSTSAVHNLILIAYYCKLMQNISSWIKYWLIQYSARINRNPDLILKQFLCLMQSQFKRCQLLFKIGLFVCKVAKAGWNYFTPWTLTTYFVVAKKVHNYKNVNPISNYQLNAAHFCIGIFCPKFNAVQCLLP